MILPAVPQEGKSDMINEFVSCLLQIWDEVKKNDRYCPLGGEHNSMRVFYEAGLLFESNIGSTPYRQGETSDSLFYRTRSVHTLWSFCLINAFKLLGVKKSLFNLFSSNVSLLQQKEKK